VIGDAARRRISTASPTILARRAGGRVRGRPPRRCGEPAGGGVGGCRRHTREAPGGATRRSRSALPGPPEGWSESTTRRSTGVSLHLDVTHRPSSRVGRRAMPVCRPVGRRTGPAAVVTTAGRPASVPAPGPGDRFPGLRCRSRSSVCWLPSPVAPGRPVGCPTTGAESDLVDRSPDLRCRNGAPVCRSPDPVDSIGAVTLTRLPGPASGARTRTVAVRSSWGTPSTGCPSRPIPSSPANR
jgi:hypothetical protein